MSTPWRLGQFSSICRQNERLLLLLSHLLVDMEDEASVKAVVNWWTELTAAFGEGMVVKPLDYLPTFRDRLIQPGMKCRDSENCTGVDLGGILEQLKQRHVKAKRALALNIFWYCLCKRLRVHVQFQGLAAFGLIMYRAIQAATWLI